MRALALLVAVVLGLVPAAVAAQVSKAPASNAAVLTQARKAAAAGRVDEALRLVDGILAATAGNRDAAELKIGLFVSKGDLDAATAAYDAYARAAAHDRSLLGLVAIGTLGGLAGDPTAGVRTAALEALAAGPQPAARDLLKKASAQGDEQDVHLANAALARLGDAGARSQMIEATRVGTPSSRAAALRALKTVDQPAVHDAVKAALNDPDPFLRAAAAEVAGLQKIPGTTDALKAAMAMPHPILRLAAMAALTRMGVAEGRTLALETLASPLADVRLMAAAPLASTDDTSWVAAIRHILDDPAALNRVIAAELMLKVEPKLAGDLLVSATSDPNPIVRAEAGRVLVEAAGPPAVLRKLLGDASGQVRVAVAAGLAAQRHRKAPGAPPRGV